MDFDVGAINRARSSTVVDENKVSIQTVQEQCATTVTSHRLGLVGLSKEWKENWVQQLIRILLYPELLSNSYALELDV